jgi:hypothetical protein
LGLLRRPTHRIPHAKGGIQSEILPRKKIASSLTFRVLASHIVSHLWKFETRKEKTGGQTKDQVGWQRDKALCPSSLRRETTTYCQIHAPS